MARARSGLDDQPVAAAGHRLGAGDDLGDDALRRLRARVVGGDHDDVAVRGGDAPHERPFAAVAVAAAAEDGDDASWRQVAGAAQQAFERIGLVRIVDGDGEVLAAVDQLEAAGHGRRRRQAGANGGGVEAERETDADGGKRVVDVEVAEVRHVHGEIATRARGDEARTGGARDDVAGPNVGLAVDGKGEQLAAIHGADVP